MQRDDAVAADWCLECLRVIAAGSVGLSVPCVAVACGCIEFVRYGVVDGKVQGVDLGAAVGVKVRMCVGAALDVLHAVPVVEEACIRGDGGVLRMTDGEVQYHRAVTALCGLEGLGIGAVACVGLSAPGVVSARSLVNLINDGVVDCQVQGVDLGATMLVGV